MSVTRHFFVDEAGDLSLFGRRGKPLVGVDGVSKCFMVGQAEIGDPLQVTNQLEALRREILADSYLLGIPSLQPEERKTALFFHAKDDCPEVRMRAFQLLRQLDVKVQVGIRRKSALRELSQQVHAGRFKLDVNQVYDDIVKTLFKGCLHKAAAVRICFARRGKSDRQRALEGAIERARQNFARDTGIRSTAAVDVQSAYPHEVAGLQVIDYFLWALQRMLERGEDRFFNYLRDRFRRIMDFDDKRKRTRYGRWYSDSDPLTIEKWLPLTD